MAFTTQTFLFLFFPVCLSLFYTTVWMERKGFASSFLKKIRASDLVLLLFGCVFYMWACFDDLFRFALYILIIYLLAVLIQYTRKYKFCVISEQERADEVHHHLNAALPFLFVSILFVFWTLIHFKYTGLLTPLWNYFFKDALEAKSVVAPLGISFITFSAVSYLTDTYRGTAPAGSLIDCALYLTFFPKVVSGPTILWKDFAGQIRTRTPDLAQISDGVTRIMIGFAKKLILADTFGASIASVSTEMDAPTAFGIGLLYMLQLYYDFSGYSDIAIGLSNLFGFQVKENFNFPYLSCSITEFWRRWHISLGAWFREYIYFPLGGSRFGVKRTILNIGIIFLLTGIWHGAGWTYMLWGILNGLFNIGEKLLKDNSLYQKTPKFVKWSITMVVTYFCWEIFRFENFGLFTQWLMTLFGVIRHTNIPYTWQYYFDTRLVTLMTIAILGSTVWGLPKVQAMYQKVIRTKCGYFIHQLTVIVLFVVAIMFMVNSKYSPFIYLFPVLRRGEYEINAHSNNCCTDPHHCSAHPVFQLYP